jgi:RHS repeat-associated protein
LPGGGLAYRTGTGTAYGFEITDLHGTPFLTLDSTAQVPAWRQFTPFGAPRGSSVTWPDNRGFLDKPADQNTGLTVVGAREYDPNTGRFVSLDPILEATSPQELNGYTYAADDPVSQADPSGLMLCADGLCGSVQYLEQHVPSGGGGGGGGGNGCGVGGCGGICYYCHYAPPRYTGGPSYQTPTASPNASALPGQGQGYNYTFRELLGRATPAINAVVAMRVFEAHPGQVFPFPIGGCPVFRNNSVCTLFAGPSFVGGVGQVRVNLLTNTSFRFTVISQGYFDAPGSTITFATSESHGNLYLSQHGVASSTAFVPWVAVHAGVAEFQWIAQAASLANLLGIGGHPTPSPAPGG